MDDRSARPAHSIDAFHRGAFHLAQPLRGHRAGTDAMVLAACVPNAFTGHIVDLGAGAGAGALAVLSRCRDARATLVERSPEMVEWATRTLSLPGNADLASRASLLHADVTLRGSDRRAAGLADRAFDFAIMNPPFNATPDRPSPDPLRREAHAMETGLLEAWVRTAAAVLKPGGQLAAILRPASLDELLAALRGRFGGVELIAVHPRPGLAAIRIVIRAARGSRAALSIRQPFIVHAETGNGFTTRAEAVHNGQASLFED